MSARRMVRVVVHGLVQGVGFRAWTEHHARRNGLDGWVRNRHDGTVEAVFSGPAEQVQTMLTTCRRGPRGSRVDEVSESEAAEPVEVAGFHVRETA